jgi:hypothetical protein
MNCPPELAPILLNILETGLLRIRSLAWSDRADLCAVEADHIHNIPSLLEDYTEDKLRYYWEVERISYIERSGDEHDFVWAPLWERLRLMSQPSSRAFLRSSLETS